MTIPEETNRGVPGGGHESLPLQKAPGGDAVPGDADISSSYQSQSQDPPPLPRPPEREAPPRPEPPPRIMPRRLEKSIGMALPRNRFRIFLGRGAIPPVSETKQFVAPLAEINKVKIRILQGDDEAADRNEFLAELKVSNIRLREDGRAELEIEFSLSATGVLSVRVTDRIGDSEGAVRFVLPQFRKEPQEEVSIAGMPIEELSRKIDLLEQQMQLLKNELESRREGK